MDTIETTSFHSVFISVHSSWRFIDFLNWGELDKMNEKLFVDQQYRQATTTKTSVKMTSNKQAVRFFEILFLHILQNAIFGGVFFNG